jgi:hypothetical protein
MCVELPWHFCARSPEELENNDRESAVQLSDRSLLPSSCSDGWCSTILSENLTHGVVCCLIGILPFLMAMKGAEAIALLGIAEPSRRNRYLCVLVQ